MKHLTLILIVLSFAACSDLDLRRGAVGESCSGADEDCREGLICNFGQCAPSNLDIITCDQVCLKFAECGARESGCESDCRITVENWDPTVREVFSDCLLNSMCSDISANQAQQLCYDDLAISDYEKNRCDEEWEGCGLSDSFRNDCYRLAKVAPQNDFQSFDDCTQAANENLSCDTHQSCIDSSAVF